MDINEAKKRLMEVLLVAVVDNAHKMYIFADQDEDNLYVVYKDDNDCPHVTVLDGEGAIYRALLGTMESRRVLTGEFDMDQDWCLDFTVAGAKAHFDLTATHMVVVKIISQPAVEAPRPVPPPPLSDDDLTIDESELATAVEESLPSQQVEENVPIITEPMPITPLAPVLEKMPENRAMDMVGAIMLSTKPFPSEIIQLVPVVMTNRGQFVPLFFDGQKRLWVAMTDPTRQSVVQDMVGQEVAVCHVDYNKLQELLRCYRTDPRHKRF